MNKVKGNLLDMFDNGDFDVIVHGCNCQWNMGGGIAAQIAKRFPIAERADQKTEYGDKWKLGTIDPVWLNNPWLKWFRKPKIIINAYTQFFPGADARLEAVNTAFMDINAWAEREGLEGLRIGIPAIGCGIGGLEWEDVERDINYSCGHLNITLVEYDG